MKNNRKTSILPNIFGHNPFFSLVTPIFYMILTFLDKFYITYLLFFKKTGGSIGEYRVKRSKKLHLPHFPIKNMHVYPFPVTFYLAWWPQFFFLQIWIQWKVLLNIPNFWKNRVVRYYSIKHSLILLLWRFCRTLLTLLKRHKSHVCKFNFRYSNS